MIGRTSPSRQASRVKPWNRVAHCSPAKNTNSLPQDGFRDLCEPFPLWRLGRLGHVALDDERT